MKKTFILILFFVFTNQLFALVQLSKLKYNSLLQAGDHSPEVYNLQQILNINPDTKIAGTGPGSVGHETWYFGLGTMVAVKKFQVINNLTPNAKVDVKTLKAINKFVDDFNSGLISFDQVDDSENVVSDSPTKSTPVREIATPYISATPNTLSGLLDKYFGFLKSRTDAINISANSTGQDIYSNTYSLETPYLNQQNGTYSSNPAWVNGGTSGSASGNTSNGNYFGASSPYGGQGIDKYSGGPFGGGTGGGSGYGQTPFSNAFNNGLQSGPSAPVTMNASNYDSNPGGDLASKFTKLPDGWLSGKTSHFGTEMNGGKDQSYKGYGAGWCGAAMNSKINTCDPSVCIASLPISAQIYFFGTDDQKANLYKIRQGRNDQQLAAAGGKNFYSRIGGTPLEIVNTKNNTCTVAPLWETGPGEGERGGFVIDVTPCIKKTLQDSGTPFISKFRPVPKGKRGCEDYSNYIPTLVK